MEKMIDHIFAEWNTSNTPGCALGIMKDGQLIYAKGYGMANLEYDIPNSPSSVFRIASTSKQFTAACITLLVEQGKLSLDKTLKEIYQDFPDYSKKITIQHLLNHTSGLRDYLQISFLKGLGDNDFYQDKDIMKWLVNQSNLNFEPGNEFLYSNSGYWLLGQIVQETTGMNMADFAKKELFKPLGMSNTHFHNDHTKIVKNRASGYLPNSKDDKDGFQISMTTLEVIGDGGIFTTINDIKKWDDAFYDSSILSKKFWEMMTEQAVLNNGEVIPYASGLFIDKYKGLKTISHAGEYVGFTAELLRFPDEHCSIAIFTNIGDVRPTDMAYQVANILLKEKLEEDIKTLDTIKEGRKAATTKKKETNVNLTDYIGSYYSKELTVTYHFEVKNDRLFVQIEENEPVECTIAEIDAFSTKYGLVRFQKDEELVITGLELDSGRVKNLKFEKK